MIPAEFENFCLASATVSSALSGVILFAVSALIYGYEMAIGIRLWLVPSDTGALSGLLELMLGAYAVGLGRAWELLGAPRLGWSALLMAAVRRVRERETTGKPPSKSP